MSGVEHYDEAGVSSQLTSSLGVAGTESLPCSNCGRIAWIENEVGFLICSECGYQNVGHISIQSEVDEGQLARVGVGLRAISTGKKRQKHTIDPLEDELIESSLMIDVYTYLVQQQGKALIDVFHCHNKVYDILHNIYMHYIEWWYECGWGKDERYILIGKMGKTYRRVDQILPVQNASTSATYEVEDLPEPIDLSQHVHMPMKTEREAVNDHIHVYVKNEDRNDDNAIKTERVTESIADSAMQVDRKGLPSNGFSIDMKVDKFVLTDIPADLETTAGADSRTSHRKRRNYGIYDANREQHEQQQLRSQPEAQCYPLQAGELSLDLSLVLCYIACTLMQEGVTMHDIRYHATHGRLPFYNIHMSENFPIDLQERIKLRPGVRVFFAARMPPSSVKELTRFADIIYKRIQSTHTATALPMQLPTRIRQNNAAIIHRWVNQLKLPDTISTLSIRLVEVLEAMNRQPSKHFRQWKRMVEKTSDQRKNIGSVPIMPSINDTICVSCIIIAMKLMYGVNDRVRRHWPYSVSDQIRVPSQRYQEEILQKLYSEFIKHASELIESLPTMNRLKLFLNLKVSRHVSNNSTEEEKNDDDNDDDKSTTHVGHPHLHIHPQPIIAAPTGLLDDMSDMEFVDFCAKHIVPTVANADEFQPYIDMLTRAASRYMERIGAEGDQSDEELTPRSLRPRRTARNGSSSPQSHPQSPVTVRNITREQEFQEYIQYMVTSIGKQHDMYNRLLQACAKHSHIDADYINDCVYGISVILHKYIPSLKMLLMDEAGMDMDDVSAVSLMAGERQTKKASNFDTQRRKLENHRRYQLRQRTVKKETGDQESMQAKNNGHSS